MKILPAAVLCGLLAAFAPASPCAEPTLFERMGGEPVLTRVIDQMVTTMVRDPEIADRLDGVNLTKFRQKLYVHMCATTGGPCTYTGEDMYTAHDGMHITKRQLDVSGAALTAALDANGVGKREQAELAQIRAPMKAEILRTDSATAQASR